MIPARDRGHLRTDFTLRAFAPAGSTLSLERIKQSLPFSWTTSNVLTSRNAGGPPSCPSWICNPQYKLVVKPHTPSRGKAVVRLVLQGEKGMAWNIKLLWGKGELVVE